MTVNHANMERRVSVSQDTSARRYSLAMSPRRRTVSRKATSSQAPSETKNITATTEAKPKLTQKTLLRRHLPGWRTYLAKKNAELAQTTKVGNVAHMWQTLRQGGDIYFRERNNYNRGLIHAAVEFLKNDHALSVEMIQALVAAGADINTADDMGNTPLHLSCKLGNAPATETLLNYGAHATTRDHQGNTALHAALQSGSVNLLRVLVRDPSIRDLLRTANDEIKKEIFREAVAQNNLPLLADLVRQYMLISHVTFNNVKEELLAACPAGSYMSRLFEKLQDLLPSQRSSDVQFLSHPSLGTARGRVLATARKYQSVNSKSYAPISSPRRDWLSLTVVRIQRNSEGKFNFDVTGGAESNILPQVVLKRKTLPIYLSTSTLQTGDEIISVDETQIAGMPHDAVVEVLKNTSDIVSLTVLPMSARRGLQSITQHNQKENQKAVLLDSVSLTTRPPISGEVDGHDYHFVSSALFHYLLNRGLLKNWSQFFDHFYGNLKVSLEIDPRHPLTHAELQSGAIETRCGCLKIAHVSRNDKNVFGFMVDGGISSNELPYISLVTEVIVLNSSSVTLKPNDAILAVDGIKVACETDIAVSELISAAGNVVKLLLLEHSFENDISTLSVTMDKPSESPVITPAKPIQSFHFASTARLEEAQIKMFRKDKSNNNISTVSLSSFPITRPFPNGVEKGTLPILDLSNSKDVDNWSNQEDCQSSILDRSLPHESSFVLSPQHSWSADVALPSSRWQSPRSTFYKHAIAENQMEKPHRNITSANDEDKLNHNAMETSLPPSKRASVTPLDSSHGTSSPIDSVQLNVSTRINKISDKANKVCSIQSSDDEKPQCTDQTGASNRIQVYDNKQYAENINSAALPSNSLQGESISTDAQQPTQQKENYHQGNELAPQISSNNDSGLTNSMAVKNVPAFEIEESSQHPTSSTDTAESEYLEIYPTDMVISQERSLTSDVNIEAGLRFCVKKLSEERRLHEEFVELANIGKEATSIHSKKHRSKNRYGNITAYDHTRVVLQRLEGDDDCDYYNANYLPSDFSKQAYIACQGPTPSSFEDFWRMVWQVNARIIVMVTKESEMGRIKCHRYWPTYTTNKDDGNALEMGFYTVHILSEEVTFLLTERTLVLERYGESSRTLKHIQYHSWPDHGIPNNPGDLLLFRNHVKKKQRELACEEPLIVHCSAGVGRSGTFIAIDRLMQRLEAVTPTTEVTSEMIDFFPIVKEMRECRNLMVQTPEQYVFLYKAASYLLSHCRQVNALDISEKLTQVFVEREEAFIAAYDSLESLSSESDD